MKEIEEKQKQKVTQISMTEQSNPQEQKLILMGRLF